MKQSPNPFSFWASAVQMGWIAMEAQAVIAMRLWGMAGLWAVAPSENRRMVSEKAAAFTRAGGDAALAVMTGKAPAEVVAASLRPIRRTTRSNVRRLSRRGPGKR